METTVNLAGKATVGKIKGTVLAYYRSGSARRGTARSGAAEAAGDDVKKAGRALALL